MPILIALVVIGLTCVCQYFTERTGSFGFFNRLSWITYDWRVRFATRFDFPVYTNFAGVFIDDIAIKRMHDGDTVTEMRKAGDNADDAFIWPWPRLVYGRIVRELSAQGARAIGFDILFDQRYPDNYTVAMPDGSRMGSDEFFSFQLARAGNVALAADLSVGDERRSDPNPPSSVLTPEQADPGGPAQTNKTVGKYTVPSELFLTNCWRMGNIYANLDSGVLRRAKAYVNMPPIRIWHPSVKDYARAVDLDLDSAIIDTNGIAFRQRGTDDIIPLPLLENGGVDMEEIGEDPVPDPVPAYLMIQEKVWHLGIVLAARELGLDLDHPTIEEGRITLKGPGDVKRVIPVDEDGYFFIDWAITWDSLRAQTKFMDSVESLLIQDAGRMNNNPGSNELYKDKLVVIGSVGSGNNVSDMGATPLEDRTLLVTKHFNVANSVIMDRFVQRHSYGVQMACILFLGIVSATLTWRLRAFTALLGMISVLAIYVVAGVFAYVEHRYWFPFILPVFGAVVTYGGMVTYRVVFEQREQRRVKSMFSKLVSPNVVNELLESESIHLGGARREITVFFADVRGFTSMTDVNQAKAETYVREHGLTGAEADVVYDRQARDTLETVNLYLATIADVIKKHAGTLDKYMGDCVMAFWGAPTPNDQHALCCVRAAIDAQRAMYDLRVERFAENKRRELENEDRRAAGQEPLPMLPLLDLGTGINSGVAIVGLMGSDAHIVNYTVFGREVNLASRLEGVSGRGRIIIGEATHRELCRDDPALAAQCAELAPVTVKGITQPVRIFEVPWKIKGTGTGSGTGSNTGTGAGSAGASAAPAPAPVPKAGTPNTDPAGVSGKNPGNAPAPDSAIARGT